MSFIFNLSDLIIVFKYYPLINLFFKIYEPLPELQLKINRLRNLADKIVFLYLLLK